MTRLDKALAENFVTLVRKAKKGVTGVADDFERRAWIANTHQWFGLTNMKRTFAAGTYNNKAIIFGISLEVVAFVVGAREIYLGGLEEFGGYLFSILHIPSSLLVAYLFQSLEIEGQVADYFFILLVTIFQAIFFAACAHGVIAIWIWKRMQRK